MASKKRSSSFYEVVYVPGHRAADLAQRFLSRSEADEHARTLRQKVEARFPGEGRNIHVDAVPGKLIRYGKLPLKTELYSDGWYVFWQGQPGKPHRTFRDADDYAKSLMKLEKDLLGLFSGEKEGVSFSTARGRRHQN